MPPLKSLTSGCNKTRGNKGGLRYLDAALVPRHEAACSLRAACSRSWLEGVASEPNLLDVSTRRVGVTLAQGATGMRLDMPLF